MLVLKLWTRAGRALPSTRLLALSAGGSHLSLRLGMNSETEGMVCCCAYLELKDSSSAFLSHARSSSFG